jgi:pimeloyl-ACP methyl ester carboxylesterase
MSDYLDAGGVRTWYDDHGAGEPLVLLHGGLTDSRDFDGNLGMLADRFRLLMPDRRGHGRTPDVPGPLWIETLAEDAAAFIERVAGGPVLVAGYSAGAIVALWLAAHRPDLVRKLVLISGAFDPDGMILRPTAGGPPPPPLLARYAEVSPDGPEHFPIVIAKVVEAANRPGMDPADLAAVTCPALVVAGDDDMVTLDHTVELYRALPDAQLAIVPNASHLLLHEKPEQVTALIADFLIGDPAPTMMPIRRAG